ncbi:MAG: ATP-binding protein [Bacteroidales bacterium]|nr:ATP-binding protein [Bacteroidales bacterium]
MIKRFDPIEGRNSDIIESIMQSDEVVGLGDDLKFKIRLCVEEVEENILCYSGSTWVEAGAEVEGDHLSISFRDGGVEFDPLAKADPDINAPLEERQIGGLGIFLCKQMMDVVEYKREGDHNVLKMKINIKL